MFSRWIRLSGVSRGTSTSRRRSLSITSAQRWIRLPPTPWAIAARVDIEHGATTAAGASDDPDAKGWVMSRRSSTRTGPGPSAKRAVKRARISSPLTVGRGPRPSSSWAMTWRPASLTHRPTSQPAPESARRRPPA